MCDAQAQIQMLKSQTISKSKYQMFKTTIANRWLTGYFFFEF
jgi:hypothetical protein